MPDLDLEQLVRAERPAPDPGWAGRLDRRVAEGFPKPPRRYRGRQLRGALLTAGAVASVLVVIVGVASRSGGGGSTGSSGPAVAPAARAKAPESAGSAAASAGSLAPQTAPIAPRAVIRSVALTLSTRPADVERVSDRVIRVADTLGGYVQDSSVSAGQSAEITLRIPSGRLQQALTQLSGLAHVRSRTQVAQDVTDQRAALEARVRDARAYRDSLRNRLAHATSEREASSLRDRLQRAERTLRARERDVAQLSRETSYATVDVSVRGDRSSGAAAPAGGRWTPGDALHDAGRVLEIAAGVALIALAVALPIGLIAAVAAVVARVVGRRRRERALELA
jgi:hypothetical protein